MKRIFYALTASLLLVGYAERAMSSESKNTRCYDLKNYDYGQEVSRACVILENDQTMSIELLDGNNLEERIQLKKQLVQITNRNTVVLSFYEIKGEGELYRIKATLPLGKADFSELQVKSLRGNQLYFWSPSRNANPGCKFHCK